MDKRFLIAGSFFGFMAVGIGAFGAHGLETVLNAKQLTTLETGVRYQMYHALLLLFLGLFSSKSSIRKTIIFWSLTLGIVMFSWSIYGLATNTLTNFDFKVIALMTPIGGILLLLSWVLIFYSAVTLKKE